jgi:hypothetical protein
MFRSETAIAVKIEIMNAIAQAILNRRETEKRITEDKRITKVQSRTSFAASSCERPPCIAAFWWRLASLYAKAKESHWESLAAY